METEKQHQKQYDWLKPHQWKKGQSGNPAGKKPGTKSVKAWVREYFEQLDDEEKMEFLNKIDPKVAWEMAEGKPDTKTDITSKGEKLPTPLLANVQADNSTEENTSTD